MRRVIVFAFSLIILLVSLTTCINLNAHENDGSSYDHVIILAFDGWGSSSFESANMPFLKSKLSESAWTTHKRSVLPTSSACNWASMFKGVGPEAHGFNANIEDPAFDVIYTDKKGNFPSLFSLYRENYPQREMGYLYQWTGMQYIFDIEDFSFEKQFPTSYAGSEKMETEAINYIKDKKPGLVLFVWDYPDRTGHTIGWYTEDYMEELTHIDSIIKNIVNSCVEAGIIDRTLFVITSDHGGHDKTHGQPLMSDLETPFVLFGDGISPGVINEPLMQYDVASILADYLHIEKPTAWRGRTPDGLLVAY